MDINISPHHHQKQRKMVKSNKSRGSSGSKKDKDKVKVVYISTPMKVKTSASRFRAIVQELTGRESDVVRIMEKSGGIDTWTVPDHHHHHHHHHQRIACASHDDDGVPPLVLDPDYMWSSPSSSEEFIDPYDHGPFIRGQESFGPLDSSFLYDQFCHQLDVIGAS